MSTSWARDPGGRWDLTFLAQDYEKWPRTSSEDAAAAEVPGEEVRAFFGSETLATPVGTLLKTIGTPTKLGRALSGMAKHALCREKLEMLARVLARALQAVLSGRREDCARSPSVKLVEIAVRLLLQDGSRSAAEALKEGKLRGLGAENRGGVVWVSGRVRGAQLAVLLGSSALPVLLPSEPLSRAIMWKAHREDHRRGPRDATARSRRAAWIVSATRLAKGVIGRCCSCRYRDRKMEEQLMGTLPPERLEIIAPFEAAALDLFGPFWVKDAAQGRRRFKCWVVAYICMGSKAACLLPCPGYSTEVFMTTHRMFAALYGRPRILYTDHAPSLIKAAETPNWEEISSQVGAQGTDWRLTAKGCSWRNGLAERVIRSARHTLGHELTLGETLDFHQFGAVLAVVSSIINSRPLSLKVSPEGEYHALSPRDVLFGRSGRALDSVARDVDFTLDVDQDAALRTMCEAQARIVQAWRAKWLEAVFPDMVARSKWKSRVRNLCVGDVGHVKYARKVGEHDWRLAMVEVADPDEDGVVRTVTVAFRPRHKSETGKPYVSKEAKRMTIGVQRFATLMTVTDMHELAAPPVDQEKVAASEMTEN